MHALKTLFCSFLVLYGGQVFSQGTVAGREKGVLYNGVCWAKSNVDKPGTFAATPLSYGMLYQWNSKKGWFPTESVFDSNNQPPMTSHWETANNPCPTGWRPPTIEEAKTLKHCKGCYRHEDHKKGYTYYRSDHTPDTLWMPLFIINSLVPKNGYWSSSGSTDDASKAWMFFPDPSSWPIKSFLAPHDYAFYIRCVTEQHDTVIDVSETICAKDLPYEWGDTLFDIGTVSGTYRFQQNNCAFTNTIDLHLTVQQPFDTILYDSVCRGKPYNEHGFSLVDVQKDDTYTLPLVSLAGCDSVISLHLKVWQVYDTTVYDTICGGDGYYHHGLHLEAVTESFTQPLTLKTIHGCDSTIVLNLHVRETYLNLKPAKDICEGDTIVFGGKKRYETGVYDDTLRTEHGCDSIFRLPLFVHPSPHRYFESAVCYGKSYDRNGFYLPAVYADTVVQDTFKTPWGCDSIRTLMLTVNPVYDTPLYDTVCRGKDYYEHGFNLTNVQTDGFHSLTVPSRTGCDSVLSLHLTVLPVYDTLLYDSICPTGRYDRHGFQLTGVTKDTVSHLSLQTVRGCDSLVSLNLHVYPAYFFPTAENICQGDSTSFRGKWVSEAKIHYDSLKTIHGCDSIYLLDLTVLPTYDTLLFDVLCEGTPYTGYGFNVPEPGEHRRRLQTKAGCDSLVTLVLTEEKRIEGTIGLSLEDCTAHGYTFFFEPEVSQASWEWDMGDGSTLRAEEVEGYHTYADSGDYRIRLRIETYNGCENRFTYVQHVPPYLADVPILADRTVIDEEEPTVRFRAEALPGMVCRWDFGDGTTGEGESVSHTYDATTVRFYDVGLQVLNADSCVTESRMRIEVLFLPKDINTFSPNGDGINDVFMQGFRIEIINRNGVRIFTGENGWDGSYQGKPATEDTYFYKLYYRTARGERMKTGFVTLIR